MKKLALITITATALSVNTTFGADLTFKRVSDVNSPYHICKVLGVKICGLEECTQGYNKRPNYIATETTTRVVESTTTEATTKVVEITTEATTKATENTTKAVESTSKVTENTTKFNKPTLEATTEITTTYTQDRYAQRILELVNIERVKNNLAPLKLDNSLNRVAQAKSEDMRTKNYFNHTSPTYGSPFNMLKNFGVNYRYAGENIAKGQRTPEAVVSAWMNSPGHRANILNKNFGKMGVGYSKGISTYWTQIFTD